MPRVGLVIVTLNCKKYLPPLFAALGTTLPADTVVCVVDNGSTDGSIEYCEQSLAALGRPHQLVRNRENIGFAPASNRGVDALRAEYKIDCFVFLNPDTVPRAGWLEPLLEELRNPRIGSAVSLLLLPDGTLNSRGNAIHFLGFGFVTGYGEPACTAEDADLLFGSSASLAVPVRSLEMMRRLTGRDEIFWDSLFLYGEDPDLGWRLAMAGMRNRICTASVVEHHSSFVGDRRHSEGMFYLERSRWLILLSNYKIPTLLLLSPALLALEFVQCLGWRPLYAGSRWRLYRSIWEEIQKPSFRARRESIQENRVVGDRAILEQMQSSIRHGAMARRPAQGLIERGLRLMHRVLIWLVRW